MRIGLCGYFNKRYWTHVVDDLEVRALVLRDNTANTAAILHFDLVFVSFDIRAMLETEIKRIGIPSINEINLIAAATHTHTGPEIDVNAGEAETEYVRFVVARAVEALAEACDNLRPGTVEATTGSDIRFLFCRRYWMKNGTVMTNPGKLNPDILRPEGDIDPEIPILAIKRNGCPDVLVTSCVNHADTTGGNGISADWPGVMRRTLEEFMGGSSMAIPLVGASGNINHFDVSSSVDQTGPQEASRIGKGYADTVVKALPNLVKLPGTSLKAVSAIIEAGPLEITPDEIAEARIICSRLPEINLEEMRKKNITSEELARGTDIAKIIFAKNLLAAAEFRERQRFRINGIAIGESFILASLPGEPFVEIGLILRKTIFDGRICMVASLAGSGCSRYRSGYIPNAWNFGRGGYETTATCAKSERRTAELLLNAWKTLSSTL